MSRPPAPGPDRGPDRSRGRPRSLAARRSEPVTLGSSSSDAHTAAAPPTAWTQRAAAGGRSSPRARRPGSRRRRPPAPRRRRVPHPTRRASIAAGTAAEREDEVEGNEHPGDRAHRNVELAVDVGQRQDDDRAVGKDGPDGQRPSASPTLRGPHCRDLDPIPAACRRARTRRRPRPSTRRDRHAVAVVKHERADRRWPDRRCPGCRSAPWNRSSTVRARARAAPSRG